MILFRNLLVLLILSVLFVLFLPYVHQGAEWLIFAHDWVEGQLKDLFAGGQAGNIARQLIALLAIPLVVGLVPALLYAIVRRRWLHAFMPIVWVVWLVQGGVLAMTIASKAAA